MGPSSIDSFSSGGVKRSTSVRSRKFEHGVHHCGSLRYKNFSVVWVQVFSLSHPPKIKDQGFCEIFQSDVDRQVFDRRFLDRELLTRFRLRGFEVEIKLDGGERGLVVSGHVHVEAAVFFNTTVSITYRLVVCGREGFCYSSCDLTSDNMIILAGVPIGVEYSYPSSGKAEMPWGVDRRVSSFKAADIYLSLKGTVESAPIEVAGSNDACLNVMSRYRAFFVGGSAEACDREHESRFVIIDVWEDLAHDGEGGVDFSDFGASDIIAHIEERHKSELMGLLTLYPFEWPYRDERSFSRVCGGNIAIDTDDLVLVSETVGLVIGTYGLRGSEAPTDWRGYLMERRLVDHVCWPECLHMMEVAFARLHTINHGLYGLRDTSASIWLGSDSKSVIKKNSLLALSLGRVITDMDVTKLSRYASHKKMYREIEERLDMERDLGLLMSALDRVDVAVKNIDNIAEVRRSRIVRTLLAFITITSIFQVLFQELRLPVLEEFWGPRLAKVAAVNILAFVGIGLILISAAAIISSMFRIGSVVSKKWTRR